MTSRRALFGLLAGAAAAASWSAAEACSLGKRRCKGFRAGIRENTLVRADVLSSEPDDAEDSEGYLLEGRKVRARITQVISGAFEGDREFEFTKRQFDCNGLRLGYLPKRGEDVVLTLAWEPELGEWLVSEIEPGRTFDSLARRCGVG